VQIYFVKFKQTDHKLYNGLLMEISMYLKYLKQERNQTQPFYVPERTKYHTALLK